MPQVRDIQISRVSGLVTKVSPEDIGTVNAKVLKNYESDPIGVLTRRKGSHVAELEDYLGDAMDATWWSGQWGANDVDFMMQIPLWPPIMPTPSDPGNRTPGGKVILGGGGKVGQTGEVELTDKDRSFLVAIPASISNGNPFNVTVTAKKPDGTTDTAFTGPVTCVLSGWGTGGVGKTFTQNTAPAAVAWVNGVTTISCTITVPAAETGALVAIGGVWAKVKAIYGALGRGGISGESDRGWVTATGYYVVASSADPVTIGTPFNLTVTAYKSDGTVDTAYATAATISDDNANVSLSDTAIAAGDWVNGVATVSETMAGALGVATSVKILVVQNGATTPAGATKVVVNGATAGLEYTTIDATCYIENGDASPHDGGKAVRASSTYDWLTGSPRALAERQVLIHFTDPLTKFHGLLTNASIGQMLIDFALRWNEAVYEVAVNKPYVDIAIDVVTADFDTTTVVWATKPTTASYKTARWQLTKAPDRSSPPEHVTDTLNVEPLQKGLDGYTAATVYGLCIRAVIDAEVNTPQEGGGANGADGELLQSATMTVLATTSWLALGEK